MSIRGEGIPATSVTPNVSSASAIGTNSVSYAAADHQHAGIAQVVLSSASVTLGASQTLQGTLVLAGGSNVTLSATTAAGGMTVSVKASSVASVTGTATIANDVSTTNALGTQSSFALADHAHRGMVQVAIGTSNTLGASQTLQGSLVLAAGNNVTLSGGTAANAQSLSISYLMTTTSWFPPLYGHQHVATTFNLVTLTNPQLVPFRISHQINGANAFRPWMQFSCRSTTASNVSASMSFTLGLYSVQNNASWVRLASVSSSFSVSSSSATSGNTGSTAFSGVRSIQVSFPAVTMSSSVTYGLLYFMSTSAGSTADVPAPQAIFACMNWGTVNIDPAAWNAGATSLSNVWDFSNASTGFAPTTTTGTLQSSLPFTQMLTTTANIPMPLIGIVAT